MRTGGYDLCAMIHSFPMSCLLENVIPNAHEETPDYIQLGCVFDCFFSHTEPLLRNAPCLVRFLRIGMRGILVFSLIHTCAVMLCPYRFSCISFLPQMTVFAFSRTPLVLPTILHPCGLVRIEQRFCHHCGLDRA